MLPGEQKQCHLYEPNLTELFQYATEHNDGQIVQLLDGASSCAPLLEVADSHPVEEGGIWCQLKCVGRVQICRNRQQAWAPPPFERVRIEGRWCDGIRGTDADYADEAILRRVQSLHAACVALTAQIDEASDVPAPSIPADVRYMWGHESDLPVFEASLDRSLRDRRDVLTARGMDAAPATSMRSLHGLWGVDAGEDEADARERRMRAQLVSFAACADLKRTLRARAAVCRDTHARLRLAEAGLRRQHARLQASLALEQAIASARM